MPLALARTITLRLKPCRKKDDTLLHKKRYEIIVGSVTDTKRSPSYPDEVTSL